MNKETNLAQTTVISGTIEEVTQKMLLLKDSKVFENEQSFLNSVIGFINAVTAHRALEEKGRVMVEITAMNGKLDEMKVTLQEGLKNLTNTMQCNFKLVDDRLNGIDDRLNGIDTRLKQVEDDTKIIRSVINGAKRLSKIIPKSSS